jgi:hypothetical protein
MNDDFLYKRQESPAPEFVAELREKLHQVEEPQKAKRKHGQRYINWKAIAAVFVLVSIGIGIFWNTPEIHIPVTNFILGYPNESVLRGAQERLGFELPEMPDGYFLGDIRSTQLEPPFVMGVWQAYRGQCFISFSVHDSPQTPESLEWYQDYYSYLEARSEKLEVIRLEEDVPGLWRWLTVDNVPYGMNLEWHDENLVYELEATMDCVSREAFLAIAQSTLDDSP